jgi:AI-2E family transporter
MPHDYPPWPAIFQQMQRWMRAGCFRATTASTLVGLFVVVAVSLYVAAEPASYPRILHHLTPVAHRGKLDLRLSSATQLLRSWLFAKTISMLSIGVFIAVGLWAFHVPLTGTLGFIAALLTFIPNLGPVISVVPAALLAFAISPTKGILTILLNDRNHFPGLYAQDSLESDEPADHDLWPGRTSLPGQTGSDSRQPSIPRTTRRTGGTTSFTTFPAGMMLTGDPNMAPSGVYRKHGQLMPRFGFAFDVCGDGKTVCEADRSCSTRIGSPASSISIRLATTSMRWRGSVAIRSSRSTPT